MKKILLWLLVLTMCISMVASFSLVGCKEKAAPAEEEAVEAAEEEVAPTEEAAVGEPKTIVYWSLWNEQEPFATVVNKWIEDYKKVKPEITIEVVYVGREVMTKIMTARSGGETIDLVDTESYVLKGSLIKEGISLVMDEALDAPDYKGDNPWRDSFLAGTLEQYAADDGKVSVISYNLITNGFMYDKKLWRDNGWTVPETWDELLALCETIKTTSDISPITQDAGVDLYNDMWNYQIMEKLVGPGAILAAAGDETGMSWEDPAFKEAIEMERVLWDKGYIVEGAAGFTWPAGQLLLTTGEAAMELCGSWLPNELKTQVSDDFEWGTFPFPEIAGGVGKITDMESYLIGWAAFNDTKVGPEIVDFLKFCTTPENQQMLVDESWNMSTILGTNIPPAIQGLGEALLDSETLFSPHDGLPEAYPDYYKNVYLKNHHIAFIGDITPDEYIEVMKKETIEYWENQ